MTQDKKSRQDQVSLVVCLVLDHRSIEFPRDTEDKVNFSVYSTPPYNPIILTFKKIRKSENNKR